MLTHQTRKLAINYFDYGTFVQMRSEYMFDLYALATETEMWGFSADCEVGICREWRRLEFRSCAGTVGGFLLGASKRGD